MTPAEIALYSSLALSAVALLGHLKGWMNSGEKQLNDEVSELHDQSAAIDRKLIEHDRRIQSIESDMKHLPDRDSQHRLELALTEVNGRLSTMNETLKPIQATTERMNELMINRTDRS